MGRSKQELGQGEEDNEPRRNPKREKGRGPEVP